MRAAVLAFSPFLLAALLFACGESRQPADPRYRHFSAEEATPPLADFPAGWQVLAEEDLPSLSDLFPEEVDLVDSAITVASNGGAELIRVQMATVAIGLLAAETDPEQGVAGLTFLAVDRRADLTEVVFLSGAEVDTPKPGSRRFKYSMVIKGVSLITEALNVRQGPIFLDVEVLYPEGDRPEIDLDELASLAYQRIAQQLPGQE